jgi:MFS family permease
VLLGLTPSPAGAVFGRLLVGLGVSTLFVCTLKILAEWFSIREFVSMTGILMAMGGVGSLSAATPLAVVSARIGWRMSFVLVGLLTAVLAPLVWKIVRDRPADMGLPSPAEHAASDDPPIKLFQRYQTGRNTAAFWPLAIWFFFKYGIFHLLCRPLGRTYLMQVYGVTKARAGGSSLPGGRGDDRGQSAARLSFESRLKGRKPTLGPSQPGNGRHDCSPRLCHRHPFPSPDRRPSFSGSAFSPAPLP